MRSSSPCTACPEVGMQDKDSGGSEQQVWCADMEKALLSSCHQNFPPHMKRVQYTEKNKNTNQKNNAANLIY